MRRLRSLFLLSAVALAFVMAVGVLPGGSFNWRAFAQVYGVVPTAGPTAVPGAVRGTVLLTETSLPFALGPTNATTPNPLTAEIEDGALIITPNPAAPTRTIEIVPADLNEVFSDNPRFANVDVRTLPASNRLVEQINGRAFGDPTLTIQIYVLFGEPGGDVRFQINVYRNGVLIDDKTEINVSRNGVVTWLRRP